MGELQERGLITADERQAYFQFKPNGPFYRLKSFLFGGDGDKDNAKVNEHMHDGRNFTADTVMVGLDATLSGTFSPYYSEMPVIARNFFGQPLVSERIDANYDTDVAGERRREIFEFPLSGAPTIDLWTVQVGEVVYKRAKLRSWNLDTTRNGDGGTTSGSCEIHANDIPDYDAEIPDTTEQNAVLAIAANNVTGDGVFSLQEEGEAAQELTVSIGDSEGDIETALAGLGITADVTGTVVAASGELHHLTASAATGNATIYGTVTVTPGELAATLQTAVRAKGGVYANATVTGSTTALAAYPSSVVVAGASDTPWNGTYTYAGQHQSAPYYTNGASKYLYWNGGGTWCIGEGLEDAGPNRHYFGSGGSTTVIPVSSWGTASGENGTGTAPTSVTSISGTSSGTYNIQFPSGVGNVPDITATPGANWSTSSTQPGNAAGNISIAITAPENKFVNIAKVSGAGWTSSITQAGSDGLGPKYLPSSAPMEADNVLIYMADTLEQLEAIDPLDEDAAEILLDVLGHTFGVGSVWNAIWTENRSQAPSNFVGNKPAVTFGLTVFKGPGSEALRVLQEGCVMGKKYFSIRYKCGSWEVWTDLKAQRNSTQDKGKDNNLPTRTTPFIAADDAVMVWRETIIGPNADYFIPA